MVARDLPLDSLFPLQDTTTLREDSSHVIGRVAAAAVSRDGRIFMADPLMRELKVFGRGGEFLGVIGGVGAGPGEYVGPMSVTFSPDGNTLTLGDLNQSRVVTFDSRSLTARSTRGVHAPVSLHSVAAGHGDTLIVTGAASYADPSQAYQAVVLVGDSVVQRVVPVPPDLRDRALVQNLLSGRVDQTANFVFLMTTGSPWLYRLTLGGIVVDSLKLPAEIYGGVELPTRAEWKGGIAEMQAFVRTQDWLASIVAVDDSTTVLEMYRHDSAPGDGLHALIVARWGNRPRAWSSLPCGCSLLTHRADTVVLMHGEPPGPFQLEWRTISALSQPATTR